MKKQAQQIVFDPSAARVGDLIAWKYLKGGGDSPGSTIKRTFAGQEYEFKPINDRREFDYIRTK